MKGGDCKKIKSQAEFVMVKNMGLMMSIKDFNILIDDLIIRNDRLFNGNYRKSSSQRNKAINKDT